MVVCEGRRVWSQNACLPPGGLRVGLFSGLRCWTGRIGTDFLKRGHERIEQLADLGTHQGDVPVEFFGSIGRTLQFRRIKDIKRGDALDVEVFGQHERHAVVEGERKARALLAALNVLLDVVDIERVLYICLLYTSPSPRD